MAVRIALHHSREDNARPEAGTVCRDSIVSAQWALGSFEGSSRSRRVDPEAFESHRERAAHRGKERIRIAEAFRAKEMTEAKAEVADAAVRATAVEKVIRARILKKRQRRNMRALAREHNWAIHELAGLPLKEEKVVSDTDDSSDDGQVRLDPYRVFNRYFHENDDARKAREAVDDLHHS
ncbi:E3 ubiquitin-protein ligase XB3 [Hordeum vulgare]|nr:E3 ubiquitin-protein ligase XB3 [Hordeum vulgare]